jgi:hypothetical protein
MADTDEDRKRRDGAYQIIGEIVDGIAAQVSARHYSAPTQEHQLTSKIADRIEERLNNTVIHGIHVSVVTQDFPDKGPGSMESKSGGDIYISVSAEGPGLNINKGMMVQSKWDDTFSATDESLKTQIGKMRRRTRSSYVWTYGPSRILVHPASDVAEGMIDSERVKTVGSLIADAFRCREGDPEIGRDLTMRVPQSLTSIMEQLSVDHGLSLELTDLGRS